MTLGLQYNLALQIIRNDPAIARERLREAEGCSNPNLVGAYDRNHFESAERRRRCRACSASRATAPSTTATSTTAGYRASCPGALSYSTGYLFRDLRSTSGVYAFKPQYNADWSTELTVPVAARPVLGPG